MARQFHSRSRMNDMACSRADLAEPEKKGSQPQPVCSNGRCVATPAARSRFALSCCSPHTCGGDLDCSA
eukprot:5601-Eustigmatos_ZCMA.PRE.1